MRHLALPPARPSQLRRRRVLEHSAYHLGTFIRSGILIPWRVSVIGHHQDASGRNLASEIRQILQRLALGLVIIVKPDDRGPTPVEARQHCRRVAFYHSYAFKRPIEGRSSEPLRSFYRSQRLQSEAAMRIQKVGKPHRAEAHVTEAPSRKDGDVPRQRVEDHLALRSLIRPSRVIELLV